MSTTTDSFNTNVSARNASTPVEHGLAIQPALWTLVCSSVPIDDGRHVRRPRERVSRRGKRRSIVVTLASFFSSPCRLAQEAVDFLGRDDDCCLWAVIEYTNSKQRSLVAWGKRETKLGWMREERRGEERETGESGRAEADIYTFGGPAVGARNQQ